MLTGVHFILTYMCNFECDHCFLYCRPSTQGTFSLEQVNGVLEEMQKVETIEWACFEGGEPFLYHPLLVESVKLATEKGYKTAIETNTYWATTAKDAELWLRPLKSAGLTALEVSDDAFHHGEETGTSAKRAAIAADHIGLNVNSICIKPPEIGKQEGQTKGEPIYLGGPKLRGRAIEKLVKGLPTTSFRYFTECPFEDLSAPQRVHIDSFGNVHLCQGLSMGNMWQTPLSKLIADYDPDAHPICGPIIRGGPVRLAAEHNLAHDNEYVDACHMCSKLSSQLVDKFPQYLAPRQVHGLK